jgi:hypothetical protein
MANFPGQKSSDAVLKTAYREGVRTTGWTPDLDGVKIGDVGDKTATGLVAAVTDPGVDQDGASAGVGIKDDGVASYSEDWYEHIHIIPRSVVAFGTIVSEITETFEIHNASFSSQTLQTITNNATPGVSLPDISAPTTVPPHTSILRDLTTLSKTRVVAAQQGLAIFDTNIEFDFSGSINDVELLVSGTRVVLLPFEYESPLTERLVFSTEVLETINGKEQRISLRKDPREQFSVTYRLSEEDRQRMQLLLLSNQANVFALPLRHQYVPLTSAVTASDTTINVSGADEVDFRVGGLAAIISDNNTFDVLTIDSVSATQITFTTPVLNSYGTSVRVMPVRLCFIDRAANANRYPVNAEDFSMTFLSIDNSTGALTGDASAWGTYDGRILFDDENLMEGPTMGVQFPIRIYRIDNETGILTQFSSWSSSKRVSRKGFSAKSRAEILALKRLFIQLRGRQKSFWLPTHIEDLTPKSGISTGLSTIDVNKIDYNRNGGSRTVIRLTTTSGTTIIREISSSSVTGTTTEQLTVSSAWADTISLANIERIEFLELCRLDSDTLELIYNRIGQATCVVPVRTVFDDVA